MSDLQNQYLLQLIENEKLKRDEILKEQSVRNQQEIVKKKKLDDEKLTLTNKENLENEKKQKAQVTRNKLINEYFTTPKSEDDIDSRMVNQIIRHGNKAKDSITYRVNRNKNIYSQSQIDELREQSSKQWWDQTNY